MWGICLDISVPELFQRAVEFRTDSENATILQPIRNSEVSLDKIRLIENAPEFVYGENVSPVNFPDTVGKIHTIIWHFKRKEFCYCISINGKRKSERYFGRDLLKKI